MKITVVSAFSSVILMLSLAGCCEPETTGSIPNTLRPQENLNWCWAAVTQMLAEHLGLSITQCALANHKFHKTNCCQKANQLVEQIADLEPTPDMSPSEFEDARRKVAPFKRALSQARVALAFCNCLKTGDCDTPGEVDLDLAGAKSSESDWPLSWEDITRQISCLRKPMAYSYGPSGNVGHVVVIKGYMTLNGTRYLVLNDPWYPCSGKERLITYLDYITSDSKFHRKTWYNIAVK